MPKTNLNDLPGDWVAGASEMENRNPSYRDARRAGRGDGHTADRAAIEAAGNFTPLT